MESKIRELTEAFKAEQCQALEKAMSINSSATWTCDTKELARRVEREIANIYRDLRSRFYAVLREGAEEVREAVLVGMPELAPHLPPIAQEGHFSIPDFEFVSGGIRFNLGRPRGWRWPRRRSRNLKMAAEFMQLLGDEFDREIDATMSSLNSRLSGDGSAIIRSLSGRSITLVDLLVGRREQLSLTAQKLIAFLDSQQSDDNLASYRAEQQQLEEMITTTTSLNQGFSELVLRGAMLFGAPPHVYSLASG